jgi:hypothetical protein
MKTYLIYILTMSSFNLLYFTITSHTILLYFSYLNKITQIDLSYYQNQQTQNNFLHY